MLDDIIPDFKIDQMKNFTLIILLSLLSFCTEAQEQPKLVVGVVVDQMRMDYIYRYWDKYSEDGFKKLMREGFLCKNAHYNYIPTYTGPGHASIFTGATPMNNGIIANNWFDRNENRMVYCVADSTRKGVGTKSEQGKMSPSRLLAPTLGDAFKVSTQFRGKSIGISIKDRAAILPAGHSADGAYWMDFETGNFISSDHYMESLPKWVKTFNGHKNADKLAKDGWQTLLAIEKYTESTEDNTPYEKIYNENGYPVFPYDLPRLIKDKAYYAFANSPFGNTIVRQFAEQAIINEDLGNDEFLDLLTISFSSPDIIGHAFGPQSIEIEDTYIRLDLEIAELISSLNERIGQDNYTLFLTADHAAAQVPSYLKDHKIPTDYFETERYEKELDARLNSTFGEGEWILNYSNQQIFLNQNLIESQKVDEEDILKEINKFSINFPGVASVLSSSELQHPLPQDQFASMAQNGWSPLRSGDMVIQFLPGWMEYGNQGTTHGSSYNYDSHVPIFFYGFGIKHGVELNPIEITQIAPTISIITSTAFPMLSDHRPIIGAIKKP